MVSAIVPFLDEEIAIGQVATAVWARARRPDIDDFVRLELELRRQKTGGQ
jgi:hypothetical protein